MNRRNVVLIGHGMVGDRFIEEIRHRDPDGTRVRLTVLTAEPRSGYNRILLPNLLSGAMLESDIFPNESMDQSAARNCLHVAAAATRIDTSRKSVTTSEGQVIFYDDLVLATGAQARRVSLPAAGRSVAVLRTLEDAHRVSALAQEARRAHGRMIVLGGGVLGLESALALTAGGTAVTVVHPTWHLMERQVDPPGGKVLAAAMRRTGVGLELGIGAERWVPGQGLVLTDGRLLPATGMVLSAGTVPDVTLARNAGIRLTEYGAIKIDDTLTTSDPAVHAIGDCAGHPGASGGLVQPGWEQAAVLAGRLSGTDPEARYTGSTTVCRLKAAGVELACLGDGLIDPHEPGHEVLRFEDPSRGRYAKLVIRDDRVTGAIMIGMPDAASGITQVYDRRAPAPADRLALLLGGALSPDIPGSTSPAALPDHAIVCRCNMVTKAALRDAWCRGARGRAELSDATRAATGCGTCADDIKAFAAWLANADPPLAETARHDSGLAEAAFA